MSKSRFVLNKSGVRELMRSPEMMNIVEGYAKGVQNRAGKGYAIDTYVGKNRVNASVRTKSAKAVRDNYKNNTLLKAVSK